MPWTTILLAIANAGCYLATIDARGVLRPEIRSACGYSAANLAARGPLVLVTSTFLHEGPWHLLSNLAVLLVACGALERRAGAARMLVAFAIPALLADPLTALIFAPPRAALDVGASLGIFGCAGALAVVEPRGRWIALAVFLAVATTGAAVATRNPIALNHLPALALGAAIGGAFRRFPRGRARGTLAP